jgi:hypothetical protein
MLITLRQFRAFHFLILLSRIGWGRMLALLRPRSDRSGPNFRVTCAGSRCDAKANETANTLTGFAAEPEQCV